jgi:hypothetical protein
MRQGLWAGLIAAAATLGELIGFGRARGALLQPLNSIAHLLFGTRAYVMRGFDPAVTLVALAVHVIALIIWATIFTTFAGRLRGAKLLAAALIYAGAVFVIDHVIAPASLSPGFVRALSAPEISAIYVVFALALALGTRLGAATSARA